MKKLLGFMVMTLVALLPFTVNAATKLNYNCGSQDANGNITCTISYVIDASEESLTVNLTEFGGADITSIVPANGSDWTISSSNELNGVWTIILTSPGVTGEGNLFTFTYHASGQDDCHITLALGNDQQNLTPVTPDEPTDNKQTGATLPYIALGAVAVIATGAYLATRNKAKMYKI